MLPAVPGPTVDPTAVFAATVETMTAHNQWHDTLHRKANYVHDVRDYGATGDGTTDDTAAIQAACDSGKTVLFPPGTYRTTDTITITNTDVTLLGSPEIVTEAEVGVQIGTPTVSCDYRRLDLPRIRAATQGWGNDGTIGTSRGVVVKAADGCIITISDVRQFAQGLVLEGDAQGVAYNTITISELTSNAVNLYLGRVNDGWSNQNTVIGGRFHQWVPDPSAMSWAGFTQIRIASATCNNNTFIGCSLEGRIAEYMLDCDGTDSMWMMCRWEPGTGTQPHVRWGPNARRNIIQGGSYVNGIRLMDEADSSNSVLQPSQWGWVTVDGD